MEALFSAEQDKNHLATLSWEEALLSRVNNILTQNILRAKSEGRKIYLVRMFDSLQDLENHEIWKREYISIPIGIYITKPTVPKIWAFWNLYAHNETDWPRLSAMRNVWRRRRRAFEAWGS